MKSTSHQVERHLAVTISKNSHHTHGRDFALNSSEPPRHTVNGDKRCGASFCTDWICHRLTKSRIPDEVFQPSPEGHEKDDGDPQQAHKLHIVTRIKSTERRPYWEKDLIRMLGLQKAHTP